VDVEVINGSLDLSNTKQRKHKQYNQLLKIPGGSGVTLLWRFIKLTTILMLLIMFGDSYQPECSVVIVSLRSKKIMSAI